MNILIDGINLQCFHAALQTPYGRIPFVLTKIVTGPAPEQGIDLTKARAYLLLNAARLAVAVDRTQVSGILQEFRRHLLHGQYMVHQTGCDHAAEHCVVPGGFQGLGQGHAAVLLDCPESKCAVRARAREYYAHCIFAAVFSERAEEAIDWRSSAVRLGRFHHSQRAILDRQRGVWGDNIYPVANDLHIVLGLRDGHPGAPPQQLRQGARMIGGKVLDDDKSDTGIGRHVIEEMFEGFKAAGRSTQRGDQEVIRFRVLRAIAIPAERDSQRGYVATFGRGNLHRWRLIPRHRFLFTFCVRAALSHFSYPP